MRHEASFRCSCRIPGGRVTRVQVRRRVDGRRALGKHGCHGGWEEEREKVCARMGSVNTLAQPLNMYPRQRSCPPPTCSHHAIAGLAPQRPKIHVGNPRRGSPIVARTSPSQYPSATRELRRPNHARGASRAFRDRAWNRSVAWGPFAPSAILPDTQTTSPSTGTSSTARTPGSPGPRPRASDTPLLRRPLPVVAADCAAPGRGRWPRAPAARRGRRDGST